MPKRKVTKTVFGPKRKRIQNFNNKQTQIIKTRLIQISMRMEDYVYQKAPISELEAEQFIREVSSYKAECSKDERSLQVIEKLTRCMRAIIAEHQEQRSRSSMSNDEQCYNDDRIFTASPVYSLPDEDRTQLTQANTDNDLYKDKQNIIPHIERHAVTVDNNKASEIIDLCDDDDNENDISIKISNNTLNSVITSERNSDVNINNALSNLSLRETPDEGMDTDTECSQSILNDYQVTQNIQQNHTPTEHVIKGYSKIVEHAGRVLLDHKRNLLNQVPIANISSKAAVKNLSNGTARVDNRVYNLNHPLVVKVSKAINNTFISTLKSTAMDVNKRHTTDTNTIRNDNNTTAQKNRTPVTNNKYRDAADERMDTDTECSQSILNNYQVTQDILQNNTPIGRIAIENGKNFKHTVRVFENQNINLLDQIPVANIALKATAKNLSNATTRVDNRVYNLNHPLVAKVSKAINNTFASSRNSTPLETNKETPATDTIRNDNNTTVQQHRPPTVPNNKLLNTRTCNIFKGQVVLKTAKNKSNSLNSDTNTPAITKKKRCPRKKKSTEPKTKNKKLCIENLTEQKDNHKTMPSLVKKNYARNKMNNHNSGPKKEFSIPIYNKNVENDLSWLENIRYVREIGEDEYDKLSNLTDNFWDNCLLPSNFDEGDFK